MNPFSATLQPIWRNPTCVWLERSSIVRLAERLAEDRFEIPAWRNPVFPEDDLLFVDYIFVGNSINFAFTDFRTGKSFSTIYNNTRWTGAFAMWACLRRALDSGLDVLSGDVLRSMSLAKMHEVFSGDFPMPLLEERHGILNETGEVLCKHYGGHFLNLLTRCNGRAFGDEGLVTKLILSFPSFRDESIHRVSGALLKFEKRAQLLAMMYQGRALSSKRLTRLTDSDEVGPIADYSVPRALKNAGILRYSSDLARKVADRVEIPKDSIEEQEIRAQTVYAQVLLLDAINKLAKSMVNYISLDYKLWTLGRGVKEPHHLTRTTAY